jgi:micrococcal nuclease
VRPHIKTFLCSLVLVFSFWTPCLAGMGRVVEILEGDLLVVNADGTQQKIRLYGVACPVRNQPFFSQARVLTTHLSLQRGVEVTPVFTDPDGVVNALVRIEGVKDYLNGQLVSYGLAWVKPTECKARLCDEWRKLEELARQNAIGLWSESAVIPPWEWKQAERMEIYHRGKEASQKKE